MMVHTSIISNIMIFFFSSRRRHTRYWRDWSSDVCSSDLGDHRQPERQRRGKGGRRIDRSGYDAGKRVKGKKRHVLVDTQGLLMQAIIHAADIQDRDGGVLLMGSLFGLYPFLLRSEERRVGKACRSRWSPYH